ncbi:MAG: hypothetical protein GY859_15655 [Desulfobacterales bacterium]|nr:hypothetical protein [Desulfobacterales bacterium]
MSKMYWRLIEDLGVQPGPSGLDIPELKENAADEEIIAAVRRLDSARASLRQKRALLRNNSGKLIESLMEEC